MRFLLLLWIFAVSAGSPLRAAEGTSIAGPIGGTDIRSALMPPPGVYVGTAQLYAKGYNYYDGDGHSVAGLDDLELHRMRGGPFMIYVPNAQVLGGSVGVFGVLPLGVECGHVTTLKPGTCITGAGDPYIELAWSRFFGTARPSIFADAPPVPQGLSVMASFGFVAPLGRYNLDEARDGLVIGNNQWNFAPSFAVTYTTAPIVADGTEVSAKLFSNNFLTNPANRYHTGAVLDLDFAVTERFGTPTGTPAPS